jgi:hypothetical protein
MVAHGNGAAIVNIASVDAVRPSMVRSRGNVGRMLVWRAFRKALMESVLVRSA